MALTLTGALLGCSSDATPSSSETNGGAGSGGSSSAAGADSGGSGDEDGADTGSEAGTDAGGVSNADEAGSNAGGASSSAGSHSAGASAGGAPNSTSPCNYAISGEQSLPDGDAMYLCTVISRLLQQKGKGDYDLLFGGAFYTDNTHSSTIACSLSSKVAPAAGDVWELGADHPGNCDLSYSENSVASLWKSSSTPAGTGSASIKFLSATLVHGTNKPEDVYYTFEVELTATMPGETPDTPEVTVNGTFRFPSLPLGA
ncbi:MAG TPA: hypothetical protein VGC79_10095 [Polyangiaceae bacterium]